MKQPLRWTLLIGMTFIQMGCVGMTSSQMELDFRKGGNYPYKTAIRAIPNSRPDCMRLNKEEKQYYQPHNFPLTSRFCFDENYFPETMVLEYAKWKTDEQYEKDLNIVYPARLPDYDVTEYRTQMAIINKKIDDDIDKLPASAWHKVIIHPKEMLQEAKRQKRLKGKGYLPSGTELLITIEIQKDGSAVVKTNYHWFSSVSPMSEWAR